MKKEILNASINPRKIVRRWILQTLQPCQKIVPLMSESMERSLGLRESLKLRLHLIVCGWCARYLKQIKFIRQLLGEQILVDRSLSPSTLLDVEARQRINNSILEKQGHTT